MGAARDQVVVLERLRRWYHEVPSQRVGFSGWEVMLQALDRLPLELIVESVTGMPIARCPRSTCTCPRLLTSPGFFACTRCWLAGGAGAWWAGQFLDWDHHQVHRALCIRPGCDHG